MKVGYFARVKGSTVLPSSYNDHIREDKKLVQCALDDGYELVPFIGELFPNGFYCQLAYHDTTKGKSNLTKKG